MGERKESERVTEGEAGGLLGKPLSLARSQR